MNKFKEFLEDLFTNKINFSDIVNDLTTGGTTVPLSAEMGKTLSEGQYSVFANGKIIGNSDNVPASGTIDLEIITGGQGYHGFLTVSSIRTANANWATYRTYSLLGRGTNSDFSQIHTFNGSSGGMSITVSMPSNGTVRVTNNDANESAIRLAFFGTISV